MTQEDYYQLYELLYRFQRENLPTGNTSRACETLLNRVYAIYHTKQQKEYPNDKYLRTGGH